MKQDQLSNAEEKSEAVRSTKSAVGSEAVVQESNGEVTEDFSNSDPASCETGSVILSRSLPNDRNDDSL